MALIAVVLPPVILVIGLLIATVLGVKPLMLVLGLFGIYVAIVGLSLTRCAASALSAKLEEAGSENTSGEAPAFPWLEIVSRMALPAYAAVLCLVTGTFLHLRALEPSETASKLLWPFVMSAMLGLVAMTAALVTIQAIWRKTGSAGWFARSVAQLVGAAAVYIAFISAPSSLDAGVPRPGIPAWWQTDYPFSWYGAAVDARAVWLAVMIVLTVFGIASVARNWRTEERGLPWMMPMFLLTILGLLSGCSSITGPYPGHWIIGTFVLARLATYVIFIYEPKHIAARGGDIGELLRCMPGWLSAYLLTTLLGALTLAHQLVTGQFGMLIHPMLNELTMPLGLSTRPWSYHVAFWLFLTRDLLILLLMNARGLGRWSDLLGVGALASILLVATAARNAGFDVLLPVLVPGFILEPIDLLWPVASVLGLLLLLWRTWDARPEFAE